MNDTPLILILTAAGASTRMGTGLKKEYLPLGTGTVLSQALLAFVQTADFAQVIITVPEGGAAAAQEAVTSDGQLAPFLARQSIRYVTGGKSRQASVYAALCAIPSDAQAIVLIHDAARPFVTQDVIENTITASRQYGAAAPVIPAVDTQKELAPDGSIRRHLVRKTIAAVQTPQGFLFGPLLQCHRAAAQQEQEYTDDTEIWDAFPEYTGGKTVHVVTGNIANKKITYAADMERQMIHTGFGTDIHRLESGRTFVLGGVQIPAEKGELGHSDGDVLLHAISDALLGASGLGDIGSYFPPEDARWKDADSAVLLRTIWQDVQKQGWQLVNLDCVVECERPKILPWRERVISSIAAILSVPPHSVFVKAKTNEKLDSVGQGNAIKAYCSCLLQKA